MSQNRVGSSVNLGVNRIGYFASAGIDFDLNGHQFHGGIKFYCPDLVFETNVIGPSLGYNYSFNSGNWFFGPGFNAALFHEKKTTNEMFLSEVLLKNKFGYEFGERVSLYSNLGIGAVINRNTNSITAQHFVSSYINYEFSLGIIYYWRVPADN